MVSIRRCSDRFKCKRNHVEKAVRSSVSNTRITGVCVNSLQQTTAAGLKSKSVRFLTNRRRNRGTAFYATGRVLQKYWRLRLCLQRSERKLQRLAMRGVSEIEHLLRQLERMKEMLDVTFFGLDSYEIKLRRRVQSYRKKYCRRQPHSAVGCLVGMEEQAWILDRKAQEMLGAYESILLTKNAVMQMLFYALESQTGQIAPCG